MLHDPTRSSQYASVVLQIIRIFFNPSKPGVNIPGGVATLSSRSIFRTIDPDRQTEKLDKT